MDVQRFTVRCIDNINRNRGGRYKYLEVGRKYVALDSTVSRWGTPLYIIRTPKGETHYPKRLFKQVEIPYHPDQNGDTEDDL